MHINSFIAGSGPKYKVVAGCVAYDQQLGPGGAFQKRQIIVYKNHILPDDVPDGLARWWTELGLVAPIDDEDPLLTTTPDDDTDNDDADDNVDDDDAPGDTYPVALPPEPAIRSFQATTTRRTPK